MLRSLLRRLQCWTAKVLLWFARAVESALPTLMKSGQSAVCDLPLYDSLWATG